MLPECDTEHLVRLQATAMCMSDPIAEYQRSAITFDMVFRILASSELPHEYIDGLVVLAASGTRFNQHVSLPLSQMTWSAAEKCWIVCPKRNVKGRGQQASAPVVEEHVCHPYWNDQLRAAYDCAKARQNALNSDPILGFGNEEPVALQWARQAARSTRGVRSCRGLCTEFARALRPRRFTPIALVRASSIAYVNVSSALVASVGR
jgi:hypothetical protein